MFQKLINFSVLFILSLFLANQTFANSDQKHDVDKVVERWVKSYENRDAQNIVALFDANALSVGTGSDEILKGQNEMKKAYERDFAQSSNSQIQIKPISVDVRNNVATAAYLLTVNVNVANSKPFQTTLRLTVTLIKEKQQWLIWQSHLSAPIPEEKEGESFPKS